MEDIQATYRITHRNVYIVSKKYLIIHEIQLIQPYRQTNEENMTRVAMCNTLIVQIIQNDLKIQVMDFMQSDWMFDNKCHCKALWDETLKYYIFNVNQPFPFT